MNDAVPQKVIKLQKQAQNTDIINMNIHIPEPYLPLPFPFPGKSLNY